jgi:hypothetical protein
MTGDNRNIFICNRGIMLALVLCLTSALPSGRSLGAPPQPAAFNAATAGTWSIVPTPSTGSTLITYLRGVACSSNSDCWAVGNAQIGSIYQTLIEHWSGTSWGIVSSPNSGSTQSNLLFQCYLHVRLGLLGRRLLQQYHNERVSNAD